MEAYELIERAERTADRAGHGGLTVGQYIGLAAVWAVIAIAKELRKVRHNMDLGVGLRYHGQVNYTKYGAHMEYDTEA